MTQLRGLWEPSWKVQTDIAGNKEPLFVLKQKESDI